MSRRSSRAKPKHKSGDMRSTNLPHTEEDQELDLEPSKENSPKSRGTIATVTRPEAKSLQQPAQTSAPSAVVSADSSNTLNLKYHQTEHKREVHISGSVTETKTETKVELFAQQRPNTSSSMHEGPFLTSGEEMYGDRSNALPYARQVPEIAGNFENEMDSFPNQGDPSYFDQQQQMMGPPRGNSLRMQSFNFPAPAQQLAPPPTTAATGPMGPPLSRFTPSSSPSGVGYQQDSYMGVSRSRSEDEIAQRSLGAGPGGGGGSGAFRFPAGRAPLHPQSAHPSPTELPSSGSFHRFSQENTPTSTMASPLDSRGSIGSGRMARSPSGYNSNNSSSSAMLGPETRRRAQTDVSGAPPIVHPPSDFPSFSAASHSPSIMMPNASINMTPPISPRVPIPSTPIMIPGGSTPRTPHGSFYPVYTAAAPVMSSSSYPVSHYYPPAPIWQYPEIDGFPPHNRGFATAAVHDTTICVMGGDQKEQYFDDVYYLDTVSLSWAKLAERMPQPVTGHTSVSHEGWVYSFGGKMWPHRTTEPRFMRLHVETGSWEFLLPKGKHGRTMAQPHAPSPRAGHCATLLDTEFPDGSFSPKMFIFGGFEKNAMSDSAKFLNDLQCYDIRRRCWIPMPASACGIGGGGCVPNFPEPCPRAGSALSFLNPHTLVIYGGRRDNVVLQDMWSYDLQTHRWTEIGLFGEPPSALTGHSMTRHSQYLFLFGGTDSVHAHNTLFIFDVSNQLWSRYEMRSPPPGRFFHSCAVVEGKMWVIAGGDHGSLFHDAVFIDLGEVIAYHQQKQFAPSSSPSMISPSGAEKIKIKIVDDSSKDIRVIHVTLRTTLDELRSQIKQEFQKSPLTIQYNDGEDNITIASNDGLREALQHFREFHEAGKPPKIYVSFSQTPPPTPLTTVPPHSSSFSPNRGPSATSALPSSLSNQSLRSVDPFRDPATAVATASVNNGGGAVGTIPYLERVSGSVSGGTSGDNLHQVGEFVEELDLVSTQSSSRRSSLCSAHGDIVGGGSGGGVGAVLGSAVIRRLDSLSQISSRRGSADNDGSSGLSLSRRGSADAPGGIMHSAVQNSRRKSSDITPMTRDIASLSISGPKGSGTAFEKSPMSQPSSVISPTSGNGSATPMTPFSTTPSQLPTPLQPSSAVQSLAPLRPPPPPPITSYSRSAKIGSGAFGTVYKALNTETGGTFAVKEVEFSDGSNRENSEKIAELQKEVDLLRTLHHQHIVQFLGTKMTDRALNIFLEFVSGGSIAALLGQHGHFNERLIRKFTKQILLGLEYLHQNKIVHRDIKGANILVNHEGTIKLADFGASKMLVDLVTTNEKVQQSVKGTPDWMAPEVIRQQEYTTASDIWSVGCTIIEMATGKHPWSTVPGCQNHISVMFRVGTNNAHPPIPEHLSIQARDFLELCFKKDYRERPTATQLLTHPFITDELAAEEDRPPSTSTPQQPQQGRSRPSQHIIGASLDGRLGSSASLTTTDASRTPSFNSEDESEVEEQEGSTSRGSSTSSSGSASQVSEDEEGSDSGGGTGDQLSIATASTITNNFNGAASLVLAGPLQDDVGTPGGSLVNNSKNIAVCRSIVFGDVVPSPSDSQSQSPPDQDNEFTLSPAPAGEAPEFTPLDNGDDDNKLPSTTSPGLSRGNSMPNFPSVGGPVEPRGSASFTDAEGMKEAQLLSILRSSAESDSSQ